MKQIQMNGDELFDHALVFERELTETKRSIDPEFPWYPYGSMANFEHLRDMFNRFPLASLMSHGNRVLDVGAADGDLAFFLEALGVDMDIVDWPPTNFNGLKGVRALKQALGSAVGIYESDLDSQFSLPDERYGLIFLLGILYHLKNPYFALERFAQVSDYLVVSTRVARFDPVGLEIRGSSVAYLVGPDECNNDSTNFWIFSEAGLMKLFSRTGWEVLDYRTVGDTNTSNPNDMERDERAFALLGSSRRLT